jgi:hypothetical protein
LLGGFQRHPDLDYPDEEWAYFKFADRFGWTPNQVDDLPANRADWLLAIADTLDEVQNEKMEQAQR